MATPGTPSVAFSLVANRAHFLNALRQIKKLTGLSGQSAVFTFGPQLCIDLGGCSFRADAEGTWQGQAAVPFKLLQGLAKAPPPGTGPITISCDGKCLQIGNVTLKCKWDRLSYPRISLPLGASLLEVLSLRKRFSDEDIRRSELERAVADADSQAMGLIKKAAATLSPLRFTEDDLRRVLDDKLATIAQVDLESGVQ